MRQHYSVHNAIATISSFEPRLIVAINLNIDAPAIRLILFRVTGS